LVLLASQGVLAIFRSRSGKSTEVYWRLVTVCRGGALPPLRRAAWPVTSAQVTPHGMVSLPQLDMRFPPGQRATAVLWSVGGLRRELYNEAGLVRNVVCLRLTPLWTQWLSTLLTAGSSSESEIGMALPMPCFGSAFDREVSLREAMFRSTTAEEFRMRKSALGNNVDADLLSRTRAEEAERTSGGRASMGRASRWPNNAAGRRQASRREASAPAQGVPNAREENVREEAAEEVVAGAERLRERRRGGT
jgi:hypothetical protein